MQYLDLSFNHFNKPENIEWLPQLSSLKYLDMSEVNLSNVNNWLHVVNKLSYLTSLFLYSCNLSNIFSVPLVNSSTSLDVLDLSSNNLTSSFLVLQWLFNFNTSVVKLVLSHNQFRGLIPDAFSRINSLAHLSLDFIFNLNKCANHSLEGLYLDQNHLNGTIPVSLGKLSNLESLFLSDNPLEGVIFEAHFSKLSKLKYLVLSNTLLVFNINSDWVPPFQLNTIELGSCQLGPRFPKWLQTQKNFYWFDISNSGISDTLSNLLKSITIFESISQPNQWPCSKFVMGVLLFPHNRLEFQ